MNSCLPNSISSSSGDYCQQQVQLNSEGNSLPILNKNSTDFTSALWSQQIVQSACQQHISSINTSIVDNNYTSLSTKANDIKINSNINVNINNDITRANNIKILPVITPPPSNRDITTINIQPNTPSTNFRLPLSKRSGPARLNKFVRRLHEMLMSEQNSGIVEWRKGLLVLHSTDAFTKNILPQYFGTKNFKTFRRQLNYYGFVHVRSFSATGSTTTALWVNQDLAKRGTKSISSVLMLKRVEPSESSKTAEGRRVRKEEAASTVEDIGINTRTIQLEQIRHLAVKGIEQKEEYENNRIISTSPVVPIPAIVNCQVSQTGTESTASNSSSNMSTTSPPVPTSVHVTTFTCPVTTTATPPTIHVPQQIYPTMSTTIPASVTSDTTADDAANLLIMLSRSAF